MAFKPDYMNKRIPGSNEAMHLNYVQQEFKDKVSKGGLVNLSHYFQFSMLSADEGVREWLDSDGDIVKPDDYEFYVAADLTLSDKEVQDYLRSKESSCTHPEPVVGKKFDQGKLRWSLLDFKTIEDVVSVLELGASKYSAGNYKHVEPIRYVDALMRHWHSYISGEEIDSESGKSHLHHIICCAMFLDYFRREGIPIVPHEDL